MRPDRKARRPRISGNIRGRSNAARRDAAPVECRHHFHHGLQGLPLRWRTRRPPVGSRRYISATPPPIRQLESWLRPRPGLHVASKFGSRWQRLPAPRRRAARRAAAGHDRAEIHPGRAALAPAPGGARRLGPRVAGRRSAGRGAAGDGAGRLGPVARPGRRRSRGCQNRVLHAPRPAHRLGHRRGHAGHPTAGVQWPPR